jgi:hypothetical protein
MSGFSSSIGHGGSKGVKAKGIQLGGGDPKAQMTGTQGTQVPGPKLKHKAPPSIVGGMKGGADGEVILKGIPKSK